MSRTTAAHPGPPFNRGRNPASRIGNYSRKHEVVVSDEDRERMVREYLARGGKVTQVRTAPSANPPIPSIPEPDWAELEKIG